MLDKQEKRRPGRPPKVVNPSIEAHSIGDASLERIEKYATSILDVMTKQSQFSDYFKELDEPSRMKLAKVLAHELCYFPLMNQLDFRTASGRTGPRPKTAQSIFVTQIRIKLDECDIKLPQWKNGRGSNDTLKEFCRNLARVTTTSGLLVSGRTLAKAPKFGFTG